MFVTLAVFMILMSFHRMTEGLSEKRELVRLPQNNFSRERVFTSTHSERITLCATVVWCLWHSYLFHSVLEYSLCSVSATRSKALECCHSISKFLFLHNTVVFRFLCMPKHAVLIFYFICVSYYFTKQYFDEGNSHKCILRAPVCCSFVRKHKENNNSVNFIGYVALDSKSWADWTLWLRLRCWNRY